MIEKHDGAWSPSHHKADIPSEQVVFPSTLAVAHMESGKRFNKSDLWCVLPGAERERWAGVSAARGELGRGGNMLHWSLCCCLWRLFQRSQEAEQQYSNHLLDHRTNLAVLTWKACWWNVSQSPIKLSSRLNAAFNVFILITNLVCCNVFLFLKLGLTCVSLEPGLCV